jgi:hypothetical protein
MFTSAVVSIVVRNTIFRKAPPSVVSSYGKRSINLNKVVATFEKHIFTNRSCGIAGTSLRFLCRPMAFLFDLLEHWDVRALSIRKTGDLPLQLWVGTFPCFVAIRFYF